MRTAASWLVMVPVATLSSACGSLPEAHRSQAKDPATVMEYMLALIRRGEYGKAYYLLSAETRQYLSSEVFSLSLKSYPSLRRLILASRFVGLDAEGRACLENPLLAIQPSFELRKELDTIWTLHIGKAEWEAILERGKEFVFHQFEREGGYHVFPPDHKFTPLSRR